MPRAHGPRLRNAALAFAIALVVAAATSARAEPTLDRSVVPATGRQVVGLAVERFGRYAVTASSPQGVALQFIDRVSGPSDVAGQPGVLDGRVEGFLDHGEYRIVTLASEKGTGDAKLEVHAFREASLPRPPLIGLADAINTTLGDFEQRSWWVNVTTRQRVTLEAAGRALGDLRLWKDGQWLVDAEPTRDVLDPGVGRPLTALRLAPLLESGLYLVTAYGGAPQPWARDDGQSPLHLRLGIPELAEAGRSRRVMSPFGIDRFVVPGAASFFRLEIDEAPATMGVGPFAEESPFDGPPQVAAITKETLPPAAELRTGSAPGSKAILTITAPPAKGYVLQHFDARRRHDFSGTGRFWISTVHSGFPADSIDATGMLVGPRTKRPVEPVAAQAIELGADAAWARRFNLLAESTLYLRVREAGEYVVEIEGVDARCRIEPFLLDRPEGYEPPGLKATGSRWDLDEGWHVLTLVPETIGIAQVAVRKHGLWDRLMGLIGRENQEGLPPLLPSVRFPDVHLEATRFYALHVNEQPGVESGLVLRALPIDLAKALPIALAQGETVTLRARVAEASSVRAEMEDGSLLPVSIDGGEAATDASIQGGQEHRVALVAPPEGGPRVLSLVAVPHRTAGPLAELPADLEPRPLELPVLSVGEPQSFDLARGESRTFLVRADEAALYRLETTGLLATEGNLRNRTVPSIVRSSAGGSGRNFLIQESLRSGDYQLTVTALGRSQGHVGLALARAPILEGGVLEDGVQENVTLAAGQGIAYELMVTERSAWRLSGHALGRTLRCRLEEEGEWPLETPGGLAGIVRTLEPGRYRFILLPEPVQARIAVLAERIAEPEKREGHGPFTLELAEVVVHEWNESPEGEDRVPDRWQFTVPATSVGTIHLGNGMEGRLVRGAEVVARPRPGRPWTGELAVGSYELEVTAPRRDNKRTYTAQVVPRALLPGMRRDVTAPVDIEVAASGGADIEISSSGAADVRARLLDESGRIVASSDDAPDDWNFRLSSPAWTGIRTLRVEPVGTSSTNTTVWMRQQAPQAMGEVSAGESKELVLERGHAGDVSLRLPEGAGLLVVTARGTRPLTLTVGATSDHGRAPLLALAIPPDHPATVTARVAVGTSRQRVELRSFFVASTGGVHLGDALRTTLQPVEGAGLAAAEIVAADPGVVRMEAHASGIRVAREDGRESVPHDGLVEVPRGTSWLVSRGEARRDVAASRVVLGATDREVALRPSPALTLDVALPRAGPVLLLASAAAGQPFLHALETDAAWQGGAATVIEAGSPARVELADIAANGARRAAGGVVRVSAHGIGRAAQGDPRASSWSGQLGGGGSRGSPAGDSWTLDLAAGSSQLRMTLDRGLFALVRSGERGASLFGSTERPTDTTIAGEEARRVTILAPGGRAGRYALERVDGALSDGEDGMNPCLPFAGIPDHAGTIAVPVSSEADAGGVVRVRGATDAWLFDRAGPLGVERARLQHGLTLDLDRRGTLVIEHGLAPVFAWIEGERSQGAWGCATTDDAATVTGTTAIQLRGAHEAIQVESAAPTLLSFRTSHPVVVMLQVEGEPPAAEAWPEGARIHAWLPDGRCRIDVRPFASQVLAGIADVSLRAAAELREGIAPEELVPAGAARAYGFTLDRDATVGLGVRASSDTIDARLLDERGRFVGGGIVQMRALAAGRHVLLLTAPADGPPLTARPALLGAVPPGLGPPAEILRAYVEGAAHGGPPPTAAAPIASTWEEWLGVTPRAGGERRRESREHEADPSGDEQAMDDEAVEEEGE